MRSTITLINELPTNVSLMLPGQIEVVDRRQIGKVTREARLYRRRQARPSRRGPHHGQGSTYGVASTIEASGEPIAYQQRHADERAAGDGPVRRADRASAGAPQQAYNHAGTKFDREHLLVLSEMDPIWHELVREQAQAESVPQPVGARPELRQLQLVNVNTANFPTRVPNYWFINGRTAPDTMDEVVRRPQLPAQPYNALPRMHPGEQLLLRVDQRRAAICIRCTTTATTPGRSASTAAC